MKAIGLKGDDIVLDFFAGSASTAHAIFKLNSETSSSCRSIVVQLPEDLNTIYSTATGLSKKVTKNAIELLRSLGKPELLSEISKERIRLAGRMLKGETHRSLSGILCARHIMKPERSMYAKQDEQEESVGGASAHSQRGH
ncbi:MAG: hypothetical protein LC131_08680 [Anaerolineae bacterium]|nr:hypothetical protein [Anaerolineae bacterium]